MAEKLCHNCNNPVAENSKFCTNCGQPVQEHVPNEAPQEVVNAAAEQVQPPVQPVRPPAQQQHQQYAPPPQQPPQYYRPVQSSEPLSPLHWILTLLVLGIPLVGLIMTFVWAFSSTTNLNRKNYCIGVLIFAAIVLALSIVSAILFGSYFALMYRSLDRYY